MKMKILVLLLILLVACQQKVVEKKTETIPELQRCYPIKNDTEKFYCYRDVASETQNPEICKKIKNILWREDCFWNLAIVTKNQKYCEEIISNSMKNNICFQQMTK